MKSKKLLKAERLAREDAEIFGTGFVNKITEERIDPKNMTVKRLSNGAYCVTYGKMKPENIKVFLTTTTPYAE